MVALVIAFYLLFQADAIRLYPVDDTARDPAFRSYVEKLRAAVEARSTRDLRKLVAKDVVVGPAKDEKGWDRFLARWRPEEAGSPLWPALGDLLSLGFIQEHPQLFLSPYLVWRFPDHLNMATHLAVVRDKGALRETPSVRGSIVAWLEFDIVRQLGPVEGGEGLMQWVHVRTRERTGYVNTRDVRSPLMPRAQFAKLRGRWLLVALETPGR
ncbi:MAG TPA: hypothetical protein VES20_02640 [Bryobacteraceae bacterium]|nr:hypothetical protein [Bryobacteraceae bacterium]